MRRGFVQMSTMPDRLPSFNARELSISAFALAKLGYRDLKPFLRKLKLGGVHRQASLAP